MTLGKLSVLFSLVSVVSGCAFQSQAVKIAPEIKSTSVVSGEGKSVQLVVLDERPSKVVGQRGVGGAGADMTVDGDLQSIVVSAITTGLGQHKFAVAPGQDAPDMSRLRVEIRNLTSKNIMGFWAGTLRDEFSLKAICKSAKRDYEQMYNGMFETSIQVVPTGEANNKYISAAVSDAVNKLVNDDQLLSCLSG